jgi:alkylglycerol monooxygenase
VGSLNLIYQFWVHTEHVPKLGWYEWIFVTPSNHRVHHAQNDLYLDRNYGGLFIIWDRLFGTFQEERPEEPCVYGIRGPLRSFNPLRALTHIYVDMAQDSWHTRRWKDKLRVWVARNGWRPADVAERFPRAKTDLTSFEKYDPKVPAAVGAYALFQLVAVISLLNIMQFSALDYVTGVLLVLVLLATTVTTACWLDGGEPVPILRWEGMRLATIAGLLGIGWLSGVSSLPLLAGVLYLALNSLALPCLGRSEPVIAVQSSNPASALDAGQMLR